MEPGTCKWRLVADAWRSRLGRGPWLSGARLPATDALGREFGLSAHPAQQALVALAREGLVERAPGRGTLVTRKAEVVARRAVAEREAAQRPRRVAILVEMENFANPYRMSLIQLVQDELARRGVGARVLFVQSGRPDFAAALAAEIREGGAAAAFAVFPASGRAAFRALKLPVPLLGLGRFSYTTNAAGLNIWDKIAGKLRELRAARPAFVTNLRPSVAERAFAPDGLDDIPGKDLDGVWAARFRLALTGAGIRPDIARVAFGFPEDLRVRDPASVGASAFAATKGLLTADSAPDALVVYPDELVPGAVAAILERGLRVPGDLKCVFHCNKGMEPFAPFPCEWIANDVSVDASGWAERLVDILEGRPLPLELAPHLLPPHPRSRDRAGFPS